MTPFAVHALVLFACVAAVLSNAWRGGGWLVQIGGDHSNITYRV
jgi:hypothetical protein